MLIKKLTKAFCSKLSGKDYGQSSDTALNSSNSLSVDLCDSLSAFVDTEFSAEGIKVTSFGFDGLLTSVFHDVKQRVARTVLESNRYR